LGRHEGVETGSAGCRRRLADLGRWAIFRSACGTVRAGVGCVWPPYVYTARQRLVLMPRSA